MTENKRGTRVLIYPKEGLGHYSGDELRYEVGEAVSFVGDYVYVLRPSDGTVDKHTRKWLLLDTPGNAKLIKKANDLMRERKETIEKLQRL